MQSLIKAGQIGNALETICMPGKGMGLVNVWIRRCPEEWYCLSSSTSLQQLQLLSFDECINAVAQNLIFSHPQLPPSKFRQALDSHSYEACDPALIAWQCHNVGTTCLAFLSAL